MSRSLDVPSQLEVLLSGTAEVIPRDELEAKLVRGGPLRVKLGIDPSTPDLHLGHSVVLGALRRFQDLGHIAVLIVGDFTGRVGDPSGQSETRPMLGDDELEANAQTYLDQAGKILDVAGAEIRRNSEWLASLDFAEVLRLASNLTVARLLERDDFSLRFRSGQPIGLVEFMYPLMQGFDSVAVRADVEIGGTDHLQLAKRLVPVRNTRRLTKRDLLWNDSLPRIEVDPETYSVKADGRELRCEPAVELPMAQRYFLF